MTAARGIAAVPTGTDGKASGGRLGTLLLEDAMFVLKGNVCGC